MSETTNEREDPADIVGDIFPSPQRVATVISEYFAGGSRHGNVQEYLPAVEAKLRQLNVGRRQPVDDQAIREAIRHVIARRQLLMELAELGIDPKA